MSKHAAIKLDTVEMTDKFFNAFKGVRILTVQEFDKWGGECDYFSNPRKEAKSKLSKKEYKSKWGKSSGYKSSKEWLHFTYRRNNTRRRINKFTEEKQSIFKDPNMQPFTITAIGYDRYEIIINNDKRSKHARRN